MSHVKRTILLSTFISLSFATVLAQQQPPDSTEVIKLREEAGTKFLDSFTLSGDVSKEGPLQSLP